MPVIMPAILCESIIALASATVTPTPSPEVSGLNADSGLDADTD